jgi:hypothetical protein
MFDLDIPRPAAIQMNISTCEQLRQPILRLGLAVALGR